MLAAALGGAGSAQEIARTSWGDPDLQGIWVGSTLTPLERPAEYQGREFLSDEQVTVLETAALVEEQRLLNRPAERAPAGGNVDYRPDGSLGYNGFWLDEGHLAAERAHGADRRSFARRMQDIESDTGYDTRRRVPDGAVGRLS